MPVSVITDSVASLPSSLVKELEIQIVPILLNVDGNHIEEGVLTNQELLARNVKTSAPSPGAFLNAIENTTSDEVIILTVSQKLSSSYNSATLALKNAPAKLADNIKIIDTENASVGQGLIVLAIARAAKLGRPLDELTHIAKQLCSQVRLVGVLANVDQLVKTGRIPSIAGWASNRLGIKPLFEIRQGQIKRMLPARNLKNAQEKIITTCRKSQHNKNAKLHIGLVHSGNEADAKMLEALALEFIAPVESFTASFNQSLLAAAGEEVSGIAWWWE